MDLVSDLITRVNNALKRNQEMFEMPASRLAAELARKMQEEGFIGKYELVTRGKKRYMKVTMKYGLDKYGKANKNIISGLKRISRPGRRVYRTFDKLPRVQSGFGCAIISTSSGVLTDAEARVKHIGGEVLAYIW